MIAILEKYEHNQDFHQIVDFVGASHIRYALTFNPTVYVSYIRQFWSTARIETTEEGTKILATVDGKLRTVSESSIRRNLKLNDEAGISSLLDVELFENLQLMGYNILPNQNPSFSGRIVSLFDSMLVPQGEGSGTPTEPHHTPSPEAQQTSPTTDSSPSLPPVTTESLPTVSQGEACPTDFGFKADQDRANIAKTSTFPSDSATRVTSLVADEGSMQQKLDELTNLYTSLQRQHSEMVSKFEAHELEINSLKARIKLLEDKNRGVAEQSGDDAPINGRRLDEGEEAAKRVSDDIEEMETVLTSMDAASILTSGGVQVVPTTAEVATATVARELEEQMAREDQRMSEQITRDAEVARLHAEEELQMMINSLDRSNETVVKYLQDYEQILEDLSIGERIELISDLVKYQENYAQVLKYQTLQRKPRSKKQKKDHYMAIIKDHAGWKTKDFKGMSFEQIEAKFNTVWKQIDDFIPMGSKKEAKREDLNQLWGLVKETLSIRPTTNDKEKELWVELKRLFEPDVKDYLWTHTQNLMHAPVEWKLYDTCGVHHVSTKDQDIFMLIEKDYPLRKGLAIVMICYKLQVDNYY
nr:hypothetical protein [Tanacetum cinerariifolium]